MGRDHEALSPRVPSGASRRDRTATCWGVPGFTPQWLHLSLILWVDSPEWALESSSLAEGPGTDFIPLRVVRGAAAALFIGPGHETPAAVVSEAKPG